MLEGLVLDPVGKIDDNGSLELNEASRIAVFHHNGHTYAAVAALVDNGVQILNLTDPTDPDPVGKIDDNGSLELDGPRGIKVFEISGRTYAAVAATNDNGVQILNLTDPTDPDPVGKVTSSSDILLAGAHGIDTFKISGRTYAAVAAINDNGVQILNLTDPTDPDPVGYAQDQSTHLLADRNTNLAGAHGIDTFKISGRTYAAVAALNDNGVQILNLTDPTDPDQLGLINNTGNLELRGAHSIDTFKISDHTYAAVTASIDNGVQILDITNVTNPTAVGNIGDTGSLELSVPQGIVVFKISGHTYAAVAAFVDDGVQILNITDPTNPTAVGKINKDDTGSPYLDGATGITTFEISGDTYLAVASSIDNGVQILRTYQPTNQPPNVNAGPSQSVSEDQPVTLHGTASDPDGDPLTYMWTHNSTLSITLNNDTNPLTGFIAPSVSADTHIQFTLTATDHHNATASDTVLVTVLDNLPPVVDAGPDQIVPEGSLVAITGTATDPEGNTPLTYQWDYDSTPNPPLIIIDDDTAIDTTFTAPQVTANTTYSFFLLVTDSRGASATDEVTITVYDIPNRPPNIDAGPDQTVDEGDTVTLAGTATDPEGDHMTYLWTYRPASPAVAMDDDTSLTPNFTAPIVSDTTAITFTLTVSAGNHTVSDTATVTVRNVANGAPAVAAGPDQTVHGGDTVTLAGSATDPEGDPMTYRWSCEAFPRSSETVTIDPGGSPTGTSVTFTAPTAVDSPRPFIADDTLAFTCTFTATDAYGYASDTMTLIVRGIPEDGPVLKLVGPRVSTVTPGSTWTDPGATCVTSRDGSPLTVSTSGSVDTNTGGTQQITYTCEHNGRSDSVTRQVTVSWYSERPDISVVSVRTAIGPEDTATDYSSDANCRDREDGNLPVTSSVSFHAGGKTATITYSCTDNRGGTARTTQEVVVRSSSPPGIYLNEPGIRYLSVGDTWSDPGAYCIDAEDGRIPAKVARNGIDTTKPGRYTVAYECTDSDGNSDRTLRNVIVQEASKNLPPKLVISDRSDIIIPVNGTWSIPSATCTDKEDGDITSLIWMWNVDNVDTTAPGVYRFYYFCTDSGDEKTQAGVTVRVIE